MYIIFKLGLIFNNELLKQNVGHIYTSLLYLLVSMVNTKLYNNFLLPTVVNDCDLVVHYC